MKRVGYPVAPRALCIDKDMKESKKGRVGDHDAPKPRVRPNLPGKHVATAGLAKKSEIDIILLERINFGGASDGASGLFTILR